MAQDRRPYQKAIMLQTDVGIGARHNIRLAFVGKPLSQMSENFPCRVVLACRPTICLLVGRWPLPCSLVVQPRISCIISMSCGLGCGHPRWSSPHSRANTLHSSTSAFPPDMVFRFLDNSPGQPSCTGSIRWAVSHIQGCHSKGGNRQPSDWCSLGDASNSMSRTV